MFTHGATPQPPFVYCSSTNSTDSTNSRVACCLEGFSGDCFVQAVSFLCIYCDIVLL